MAKCEKCGSYDNFCLWEEEEYPEDITVRRSDCPYREEKETEPTPAVSPSDPEVLRAGQRVFGPSHDGAVERDLKAATPAPVVTQEMIECHNCGSGFPTTIDPACHCTEPGGTGGQDWRFKGYRLVPLTASPNHSDCVAVPREVAERCIAYIESRAFKAYDHMDCDPWADRDTLAALLERG